MVGNSDTKDGLTVLQSFIGKNGSGIAHTCTSSNALDMQIGRDMQMFVACQFIDHRQNIMQGMA